MLIDITKADTEYSFDEVNAIHDVSRRLAIYEYRRKSWTITNPTVLKSYIAASCRSLEHEIFGIILADSQNRVIRSDELFRGCLDGAAVYPREVVKHCLKYNASSCAFWHNHPSGNAEPSMADESITKRLKDALALVDIRVLDHIVVGAISSVSLSDRGWI